MRRLTYIMSLMLIFAIPAIHIPLPGNLGSVNRVIGVAVLACWLLTLIFTGHMRRPHLFHLFAALFVIWNIVSLIWTANFEESGDKLQSYIQSVGFTLVLWDLLRTVERVETGMQMYVAGAWTSAVWIVVDALRGIGEFAAEGRYSASDFDPNDIALQLAIALPFAVYLAIYGTRKSIVLRTSNALYPVAATLAIFLTGSRGALAAVIPGILFCVWVVRKVPLFLRVGIGIGFASVILIAGTLNMETPLKRVSGVMDAASTDQFSGRLLIWKAGWEKFLDKPVIGVGISSFQKVVLPEGHGQKVAHNAYLSVLTEVGIIGAVLFLAAILSVLRALSSNQNRLFLTMTVAFSTWAIGVLALTWEYVPQTWILFSFILTSASIVAHEPETENDA